MKTLYSVVVRLNKEFDAEGRKFTPDGHMVGSLGEVVASYVFNLKLMPPSEKTHDAEATDGSGKRIQIKLTLTGSPITLRYEPDHLIVLSMKDGIFEPVFNGPGAVAWNGNQNKQIRMTTLRKLQKTVDVADQLKPAFAFPKLA